MNRKLARVDWAKRNLLGQNPRASEILEADETRRRVLALKKLGIDPLSAHALSQHLDDLIQFAVADPRPRNRLGEFAPQSNEGPDPNAMFQTYRAAPPPPPTQTPGPLSVGTTAAIGGASGTAAAIGIRSLMDKLKKIKVRK